MVGTSIADPQDRFGFGENWVNFLKNFNEERLEEAKKSLRQNLGVQDLKGKIFLDVGCGSGLFSLAAHKLGAVVHSFDYDERSVACTQYLKETYGRTENFDWSVEQGSILNPLFLQKFPQADIVYSWGVLHHTGHMYQAFDHVATLVKEGGKLFISIYNDQGGASRRWLWIKSRYNKGSPITRYILTCYTLARQWTMTCIKDFLKTGNPLKTWFVYGCNNRGMSPWHDVVDWVGGYPFEVAKPEEVFSFFKDQGFELLKLKTCAGGLGCNEFVFVKKVSATSPS